jgi:hypothetical protein
MLTEIFTTIDGTHYELKRRLGWFESQTIDDTGTTLVFEMDGETIGNIEDLQRRLDRTDAQGTLKCEVRIDTAKKNLARLRARVVGLNPRQLMGISRAHVIQLLRRIEELESDENEELSSLSAGNPTTAS